MLTYCIKDELESFFDAEVYTDDNDDDESEEERVLDLDKMRVTSNRILVVWYGEFWDTKIPLNLLNAKVAIIYKAIAWFAEQINWLVSLWWQLWCLMN